MTVIDEIFDEVLAGSGGGGGITPTGTKQITANGLHDVTQYAEAQVAVENTYTAADEGKVVSSGALVSQTSKSVSENGTYNTTNNNQVVVNVPSSGVSEKWAQLHTSPVADGSIDLSDADAPAGKTIELRSYAFAGAKALRSFSSEQATYIGEGAFNECTGIVSLYLPNITSIGALALRNCGSVENWDCDFNNSLRNVQSISRSAFYGSMVGGDLVLPAVITMESNAFSYAGHITGVSLPNYTGSIGMMFASNATSLRFFEAPLSTGAVDRDAFTHCSSLVYAVFGAITSISTNVLSSCTSLKYIKIGGSTVCSLANVNAFYGCSALESIYVPDNLVDSYKAATNWSTFASKIKPVSAMPDLGRDNQDIDDLGEITEP
jgi:hypothetical protein